MLPYFITLTYTTLAPSERFVGMVAKSRLEQSTTPPLLASGQAPFATVAIIAITTKTIMLETKEKNKKVTDGTANSLILLGEGGGQLFNP